MQSRLKGKWQSDGVQITGDVAGLWLEATLNSFPNDVAEAALACAIPAWFDLRLLTLLTGKTMREAANSLEQWLSAGLITPGEHGGYVFRRGIRKRFLRVWQVPARWPEFTRLALTLIEHYLPLTHEQISRLSGPDYDEALSMLDKFYPNLEAAWEASLAIGDCELVYRMVSAVDSYHTYRKLWSAKAEWLESGILACECLHDDEHRAEMLNSQGVAYMHLLAQGMHDAVEKAIACYERALTYYTVKNTPKDFVMVHNNMGNAYMQAKGDPTINIARAIHSYEAALQACSREESPLFFAVIHSNLAFAYLEAPSKQIGVRRNNLRRALANFQAALQVYTPEKAPFIYAKIQVGMGAAYAYMLVDEEGTLDNSRSTYAHNLMSMIECYQEALRFYSLETTPVEYAEIHLDLASAYTLLSKEGDVSNLRLALSAYKKALHFYTLEAAPEHYAEIQLAMGIIYGQLSDGHTGKHTIRYLRRAIKSYQEALQVYTVSLRPLLYAQLQVYLGIAYARLSIEERSDHSQQAFIYYQEALQEYMEDEPTALSYADSHSSLGTLYNHMATTDATDSLLEAIACYEASLTVYTPETAPQAHASIQDKLDALYAELRSQTQRIYPGVAVQA